MTPPPATADRPARPAYRDGAVLRAADLRAEAADRLAASGRHQARTHRPGVAAGLLLRATTANGGHAVAIGPGMAVDGLGRWLLVPAERVAPLPDAKTPWEVWLAHREAPTPPDRLADGCEVLFHPPGRFDPEAAVFLGTVHGSGVSAVGRVYVGAVGARVEAASRKTRLLLAPEQPDDTRRFAVGVGSADGKSYADQFTVEDTGTLRLNAPVDVDHLRPAPPATGSPVAVVAGYRSAEFVTRHVLDPAAIAARLRDASPLADYFREFLARTDPGRERVRGQLGAVAGDRLARLVCRILNAVVMSAVAARSDNLGPLIGAVRASGAALRPQTVRGILDRAAGLARADAPRLARLLLEDAFAGQLDRLPDSWPLPYGVTFAGAGPDKPAAPGRVYLAEVADKTGRYRELRITIEDPGKDNHPGRHKAVVGVAAPDAKNPTRTDFAGAVTIDAAKTVTVSENLRVFPDHDTAESGQPAKGLILTRTPPGAADPNDPAGLAAQLGQVGPHDLRVVVLEGNAITRPKDGSKPGPAVVIGPPGYLENTGKGPILGARLDVVAFTTDKTQYNPVHRTLIQNLTLGPGQRVLIQDPELHLPFTVPLGPHHAVSKSVSVILMAVGAGPGGILAQEEVRWDYTENP
jgi:hypothetical protein